MKAVVIYAPGGPEQLIYQEVPTPKIKEGWSLVWVRGFGLNHSEIFTREGKSPSVQFPRILGIECVGEVAESRTLPVGQRVVSLMGEMGRAFDGSYAEYVLLPDAQIYPIASDYDWPTLAAIPETYNTAYGSLLQLRIQAGDRVLVRAAASGVGVAFAGLLKACWPTISLHGSCRNPERKGERLWAAGFDAVIADRDGVLQTETSYDKILELVGPATLGDSLKHLNGGGIVCSTGQLGNQWFLKDFDPIMELKNRYLTAFYSSLVDGERLQGLFNFMARHRVPVSIERIYRLDQLPDAHRFLESTAGFGKVVVVNK